MGRITATLASLTVAGVLVTGAPADADAATGVLFINGKTYYNPSGCYPVDGAPAYVFNGARGVAFIHDGPKCDAEINAVLLPGHAGVSKYGKSVFVG
ncbi:hypothetical protein AB0L65_10265 [Nonomuraea sp. NPDC052116]|uniref:hypothetical protein n=1 Tax=Nonomuraea sp. NPDC052116 TaxID=3155665 RepID=UPI00342D8BA5